MSRRTALLIGLDHIDSAPPLLGARADVIDLARVLLRQGLASSEIRILTTPALSPAELPDLDPAQLGVASRDAVEAGLAWVASRIGDDDDTALVHVSGRGTAGAHGGHAVVMPDGTPLPVAAIQAAFADHPVRSVLTVLDVGFAGDPDRGRTVGAEAEPSELALTSRDPVIAANGGRGPVVELELGGERRGVLSWTLGRALQAIQPGQDWRFADLLEALRSLHGLVRAPQAPVLLPTDVAERSLGAFTDGGRGHLPWRGVSAHFQYEPELAKIEPLTGVGTWGAFETTAPGGLERWNWADGVSGWPSPGFRLVTQPPGTPFPPGGTTWDFTNNGYSGPPSNVPPAVGATDRAYQVQVPSAPGEQVVLIARFDPATGKPTAMDWYTTSSLPFLPVQPGDVQTYTGWTLDPTWWQGFQWYHAHETRQ